MEFHGIVAGDWFKLLSENHYDISRSRWGEAIVVSLGSLLNSRDRRRELRRYGDAIAATKVVSPVFILGHWRSGTSMLQELLALDAQFATPTLLQVTNPHTFLMLEPNVERALADAEAEKRPMDNMQVSYDSPGEDEFALATMTLRSPIVGWAFPRREAFYDRYLTFEDAEPHDVSAWQTALKYLLQKFSYRYPQRTLLLKSPPHTARIKIILEVFPDARFLHIYRDPFTVFRSTQRLYEMAVIPVSMQYELNQEQIREGILHRYRSMHDAFFSQRALIPDGRYQEVRFEDLEVDLVGQMARLYEGLNLSGWPEMEPKLWRHADSRMNYKKNVHAPLPEDLRTRVVRAWERNFDEWGYPTLSTPN